MTDDERREERRARDREYQRRRRASHPELKLKRWEDSHPGYAAERMRRKRAADPEGERAKQKAWREANRDWIKEYSRRRREKGKQRESIPLASPDPPTRPCVICTKPILPTRHANATTCSDECAEEKKRRRNAALVRERAERKGRKIGPVIVDPWKI